MREPQKGEETVTPSIYNLPPQNPMRCVRVQVSSQSRLAFNLLLSPHGASSSPPAAGIWNGRGITMFASMTLVFGDHLSPHVLCASSVTAAFAVYPSPGGWSLLRSSSCDLNLQPLARPEPPQETLPSAHDPTRPLCYIIFS